jgi:putative tricarboxylic transport membrane protein
MRREVMQLRTTCGLLLCVSILLMLLLIAIDSKAADPSADYPSRPIELVVHSGPGSGADMFGRIISDIVQKEKILSQPIVVVNKVGGGGAIAQGYVFERKGNPHIIHGASSSTFLVTPILEKLPYNYKSFVPIANTVVDGAVLVVRSDSPFKTADDIIAEARKRPKELIQGGASITSSETMMGRSIQKVKGVQWSFISFADGPQALVNVLAGNVHFTFIGPSVVIDHVRAGKLRVLLACAPNRFAQFKDVPTTKEAGMGEPIVSYRGIVGPPNMPDYAVKKLEVALKKVVDSYRFKKYMEDGAMQLAWMSSNEYSKLLDKLNDQWRELLRDVDLLKKK